MNYVHVKLQPQHQYWTPPLFPGSAEARKAGCNCPVVQPWPGGFKFGMACPAHPLELANGDAA